MPNEQVFGKNRRSTALFAMLAGLAFLFAYLTGTLYNALVTLPVLMLPFSVWKLWARKRSRRTRGFPRVTWQMAVRISPQLTFWVLLALVANLAIVPIQFEPGELLTLRIVLVGSIAFHLIALLVSGKPRSGRSILGALGVVYLILQLTLVTLSPSSRRGVVLDPPFSGDWYVVNGGRSPIFNGHYHVRAQRHALDFVKTPSRQPDISEKKGLSENPCFGESLKAPSAGLVARTRNHFPDMPLGRRDVNAPAGNFVIMKIDDRRFLLLGHLMKGSVLVREGEMVEKGRTVGRCGNSGNTSEPHLHLQIHDAADEPRAGMITYPIFFRNFTRIRSGEARSGEPLSLRRNDRIIAD